MGERLAYDIGGVLAIIVLLAAAVLVFLSARRGLLERGAGTVECSLRRRTDPWRLGIARYHGDELRWYRLFGVLLRPRHVLHRRGLVVSNRRGPTGDEEGQVVADAAIVECRSGDVTIELAMSESALTGFLAWLEAGPPGPHIR